MTKVEFVAAMAVIEAAIQKTVPKQTAEVYFDLLGDLAIEVFQAAVKKVLLEHPWSTVPSIAELRAAAVQVTQGQTVDLSPAEAWGQASQALKKIDPDVDGSIARGTAGLHPRVVKAMHTLGIRLMIFGKLRQGELQERFVETYRALATADQKKALLPPKVATMIEHTPAQIANKKAAEVVRRIADKTKGAP